jgi:3',5'-cyclic AMP phosphodiesterase CpdA
LIYSGLGHAASSIRDEELVTVTDKSFELTWVTESETEGLVRYGKNKKDLDQAAHDSAGKTRFHFVKVTGLELGTQYFYKVESDGKKGRSRKLSPGRVTTLTPPPGKHLFDFAVMADMHVLEDIAGLIVLPVSWLPPLTKGFTWPYPVRNYWQFTAEDAIVQINETEAAFAVMNGDLTSWFTEHEFEVAKGMLDRLDVPYYVTRGNHDRVEDNPEDYFLKVFDLEKSWYSFDHEGFHFICLDDNRLSDGWHGFPEEEWKWFQNDLREHFMMPTFVFAHRPIGADWVDVNEDIRSRYLTILSQNEQVVACFNGHSHRGKVVTVPEFTRDVLHIEVPALKEYPTGYGIIRVFEGGYMYNFHITHSQESLEWSNMTRGEFFGLAPRIIMCNIEDRNFVYTYKDYVKEAIKR